MRIEEDGAAISAVHRFTGQLPMNAITRGVMLNEVAVSRLAGLVHVVLLHDAEHLEASRRILVEEIEPGCAGIAPQAVCVWQNDIGAGHNIEQRLLPVNAVLAGGITGCVVNRLLGDGRAPIPRLEKLVLGNKPDAIAEDTGSGAFPRFVRTEDGTGLMIGREMMRALERRILDEEIVHEQLTSDIDGNDFGRELQIRWLGERSAREFLWMRWPVVRQDDAVGQRLRCKGCGSEKQKEKRQLIQRLYLRNFYAQS